MFCHVPRMSAASPVDTILDKENFKLEDLLDEDEIIQECKALNTRLINLYYSSFRALFLCSCFVVQFLFWNAVSLLSFFFPELCLILEHLLILFTIWVCATIYILYVEANMCAIHTFHA
ncbi:hypothetical protein ABZP36_022022 [Zizania latifolia]